MNLEKRNTRTPAAPHRRPWQPQHQDGRGWSKGRQNCAGERCWRPRTASQPPRRRHLALVAPRRRPLSGTPRAIVDTERQWHLNLSGLVCLNAYYPWTTFINKNECLNVPSIHRTRASKWSLHWPAGPRRTHRASPDRTSHRLPQTGTAPKWH